MFYQHIKGTSQWEWRMCWGHASSADLVHWQHEPIAMQPTQSGADASGCWSGCATVDEDGTPTLLYTGVRRRDLQDEGPLPHVGADLGLEMVECQCAATCSPGDDQLLQWAKLPQPVIPHPPPGMQLAGFRDPYVIRKGGKGQDWHLLIGSGLNGQGGTLLLYKSKELQSGWQYAGSFVQGETKPCGDHDLGAMWECPFLASLSTRTPADASQAAGPGSGPAAASGLQVLCVSPYPHHLKERPTNSCLYWLGRLQNDQFQMGDAEGPHVLDLGDVLYAPNCFTDGQGRNIMFGWLQELRKGGGFDYAGCLSVPRVLTHQGGRLHQQPVPELAQLRRGAGYTAEQLAVTAEQPVTLQGVSVSSLDLELTLRPDGAHASSVLLRSWLWASRGEEWLKEPSAAAITVDWEHGLLQATYPQHLDGKGSFDAAASMRRIGGPIMMDKQRQEVHLRILVDHSAVEVFTGAGEALTTRVYRGEAPQGVTTSPVLVSHGGITSVRSLRGHDMGSIWLRQEDIPAGAAGQ